MHVKDMHVDIDTLPVSSQRSKWCEALASLGLQSLADGAMPVSADIQLRMAPGGSLFARIRGPASTLAHKPAPDTRNSAFVLLDTLGGGRFSGGAAGGRDAVSVCDGAAPWHLAFEDDFDLLVMRLRRTLVFETLSSHALPAPMPLGDAAVHRGIGQLMATVLRGFGDLEARDLAALENALTGLLASALRGIRHPEETDATQVQSAHFQRVTATIEARLSQPDLAMRDIAASEGMSQRYLQKLFKLHGTTFSDFVRSRRLEKARHALGAQDQKTVSIAEIAFRCGFADQGHFSRVFRAAFGMSPRVFRGTAGGAFFEKEHFRGRPSGMASPPADAGDIAALRPAGKPGRRTRADERYRVEVGADTVHWGFLSRDIAPVLRVPSGAEVVIETLTQHASDDYERMVRGDAGAESVFHWTAGGKNVERRGAGPMDASLLGRGAGEGFGVHVLTGPIHIEGAEPGDVLEVRILDIAPRPSANPAYRGRCFASNAATWWGYQYGDYIDGADRREIVTIFEVEPDGDTARAAYSFRWTPQTDPYGVRHDTIDYPGVPVDPATIAVKPDPMPDVRVPLSPHFGFMAVAPREHALVDSIPPGNFGGNLDNRRAGRGSTLYLPVSVAGALFSVGDGHLALGDGEINGTALECSLTGTFRFELHKSGAEAKPFLRGLAGPLLETPGEFILHGFSYPDYLRDLGQDAQAEVYKRSSLDRALRSAFRITRKFLMDAWGLGEDEAIAVLSTAVDFGITQVADGNWGVHAIIPKAMFRPDQRG
ncbi:MAG: acetamidase/formamidase family protein [Flavobacteriaceae bacterium]